MRRRSPFLLVLALAALLASLVPHAAAGARASSTAEEAATIAQRTVTCRGSANVCRARVSLAGGAANERVVIRLTDTNMRLVSVKPNRKYLRGAYLVSKGRFRLGGSEYVFRLNAVQSIPRGSFLVFTFRSRG